MKIVSDRILATPLILDEPTRRAAKAPFLRLLLKGRRKRGSSYRKTYAEISPKEFKAFTNLMKSQGRTSPRKARTQQVKAIPKRRATDAFRKWATEESWDVLGPAGYPDLLAELPNGRMAAFEGKLYPDEDLRKTQQVMFPLLRKIGLSITILKNVRNEQVQREIGRSHWKVISQGDGKITRGWPDFMLKKGRKVVACELKTGELEPVSQMQVETLSALSAQMGLEVHVIRAIKNGGAWELYDDTERWLLYPPNTRRA